MLPSRKLTAKAPEHSLSPFSNHGFSVFLGRLCLDLVIEWPCKKPISHTNRSQGSKQLVKSKTRWRFDDEVFHQLEISIYIYIHIYIYIYIAKDKITKIKSPKKTMCFYTKKVSFYLVQGVFSPRHPLRKDHHEARVEIPTKPTVFSGALRLCVRSHSCVLMQMMICCWTYSI